ncbi:YecA family protein [Gimesia aquarii]|uniref:Methionine aminopeptidase n=1 Tax=Gimesia aquarii TaxID=2527964 RepID=A0A517WWN4_9PLAN|nr:SEC-C domain-containing protein [Gimesia aquarii]QDU09612.1 methionine aminopeptidase [Gimesia aquarii]
MSFVNMHPRMGRNEPCWCGSGKKFKKCHMNRESTPRRTIQEVIETGREAYAKKVCLHPDLSTCNHGIIKAHSIQKNGGLSRIAVKGKVYGIRENNAGDLSKSNGMLAPKLVGIRHASTFTGMCGFHDDQTFAPIEKEPFVSCNEHAFLLAYRHFCKEIFTKGGAISLLPTLRTADNGQPFEIQMKYQRFMDEMQSGLVQGVKDVEAIKASYDTCLLTKDFSDVRFYVVQFKEVPNLLTCSGNFPMFDFSGNQLQRLLEPNKLPDHVTFSIIATDTGGAFIFSWLGNLLCPECLVKSLHKLPDAAIGDAVVRYAFEYCENLYMSPTWWDGLDETSKMALCRRITKAGDVTAERKSDCLMPDGHNYVNWTVTARETNLNL